jgi:hypothetical protein
MYGFTSHGVVQDFFFFVTQTETIGYLNVSIPSIIEIFVILFQKGETKLNHDLSRLEPELLLFGLPVPE